MIKYLSVLFYAFVSVTFAQTLSSPNKNIQLNFYISDNGIPQYSVNYKNKAVIEKSNLGIELQDTNHLTQNFELITSENSTFNETWQPVLGEEQNITNHYNQLTIQLNQKKTNRKLTLIFKVYNEGVAFRYEFPLQENLTYFTISDEKTQFNLTENYKTFWIPGDYDSQEYTYNETKISEINIANLDLNNGIALKTNKSNYRVQSPLQLKSTAGL